ncbi:MAG: helix-turn-helix transcriptional regulator [Spirochaetales bacterium]|nr:helix-turn-helix transcriptional regulator [Spirochaetales bacterium]
MPGKGPDSRHAAVAARQAMNALHFPSVIVMGAFILFALGAVFAWSADPSTRKRALPWVMPGLLLIAFNTLAYALAHSGPAAAFAWARAAAASGILAYALFFIAGRAVLGTGMGAWWYLAVAAAESAAILALALCPGGKAGLLTVAFSTGVLALFVPTCARNFRYHARIRYLRLFDDLLLFASLATLGRLLHALRALRLGIEVHPGIDAWLFSAFSASGIGAGAVFTLMVGTLRRSGRPALAGPERPRISLSDAGLAPAERQYVISIIAGETTKEIAAEAGISESTVRNSLARAYRKLGVQDMLGLVALAGRNDIVP